MNKVESIMLIPVIGIVALTVWLCVSSPSLTETKTDFRCWYNVVDTCKVSNTCAMLNSDGKEIVVKKWSKKLSPCLKEPMSWNIPFSSEQYEDFFEEFCKGGI